MPYTGAESTCACRSSLTVAVRPCTSSETRKQGEHISDIAEAFGFLFRPSCRRKSTLLANGRIWLAQWLDQLIFPISLMMTHLLGLPGLLSITGQDLLSILRVLGYCLMFLHQSLWSVRAIALPVLPWTNDNGAQPPYRII